MSETSGQLALGAAGFMAAGAFACFNLILRVPYIPFPLALVFSGLIAAAFGVLFGLPSLRVRGIYLMVATLIAGCLGTAVGVQKSAEFIGRVPDPRKWIFLIGLKESLNCFVSAFVIANVSTLIMAYGGWRRERQMRVVRENTTLPRQASADA